MNIIIFGPPGAGKGTQAEIIAKTKKLSHLSSGELSRQMINDKLVGEKIKKYLDAGDLIPNSIIINLVEKYIKENIQKNGFIFDGYPRNLGQAKALDKLVKKYQTKIDLVINLKLNENEALKRILLRGKNSGRSDDNLEITKKRLKIYRERTEPILEYYQKQNKLENINGKKEINIISENIEKLINKINKKQSS